MDFTIGLLPYLHWFSVMPFAFVCHKRFEALNAFGHQSQTTAYTDIDSIPIIYDWRGHKKFPADAV